LWPVFANGHHAELSAVIFSNACSIAKLNRVACPLDQNTRSPEPERKAKPRPAGAFGALRNTLILLVTVCHRLSPKTECEISVRSA
jgi:hypothetical protein